MATRRVLLWFCGGLLVLIGLTFGFILDWHGRPTCHTQLMLAFMNVMHPSGGDILHDPKPFPNVKGSSQDSLATLSRSMAGDMAWTNDYNYIPGLREDDPPNLVLMYFNRPTRWNWHGAPPTIFQKKAWIIIPVDFGASLNFRPNRGQLGEHSERVSPSEFRIRLRQTLDFIHTNKRPYWETVVAEETRFLDSMTNQDR